MSIVVDPGTSALHSLDHKTSNKLRAQSQRYCLKISELTERGVDYLGQPTPYQEDAIVHAGLIHGVLDGVSKPYVKDPDLYAGSPGGVPNLSGGQVVVMRAAYELSHLTLNNGISFRRVVRDLNRQIGRYFKEELNLDLSQPGQNPGAVGALVKFGRSSIQIAAWGDCFVFVRKTDGTVVTLSQNQVLKHDEELYPIFHRLCSEYGKVEAWRHYTPTRQDAINRHANKKDHPAGYGILNGQPGFLDFVVWSNLAACDVDSIFICSDGFMPLEQDINPDLIMETLASQELAGVLEWSRKTLGEAFPGRPQKPEAAGIHFQISPNQ